MFLRGIKIIGTAMTAQHLRAELISESLASEDTIPARNGRDEDEGPQNAVAKGRDS